MIKSSTPFRLPPYPVFHGCRFGPCSFPRGPHRAFTLPVQAASHRSRFDPDRLTTHRLRRLTASPPACLPARLPNAYGLGNRGAHRANRILRDLVDPPVRQRRLRYPSVDAINHLRLRHRLHPGRARPGRDLLRGHRNRHRRRARPQRNGPLVDQGFQVPHPIRSPGEPGRVRSLRRR